MKIILGSSSAGRRLVMNEIAQELSFDFVVISPDIDEKSIRSDDPSDLVMAIANAKADALITKIKEPAILICSDQVVIYKGKIREKPADENEAREFLQSYGQIPPETLGAVVIVNIETGKRVSGLQTSKIHFKSLPSNVIDEHIKSGLALNGAGGFSIQDPNLKDYIDHVDGGLDSAMGLSKELVKRLFAEVGDSLLFKRIYNTPMIKDSSNSDPLGERLLDLATDPEQYSQGEASSWLVDQARQDLQRQQFWDGIKDYIPKECRSMLDVGCGVGWSAKKAAEIGITRWAGIEPASSHFDHARKLDPEIDIKKETLETFDTDEKFDCIICIMIFSHIGNVDLAFKKLSDFLTENGHLIIVLSAFHEGTDRFERRGRKYDVYEIDDDQYVDKSVAGGYGIADINRKPSFYIGIAEKNGFSLLKQGQISDSGYSPKDLLVFKKG